MKALISFILASVCGFSALAGDVITHKNCQLAVEFDEGFQTRIPEEFDAVMKAKGFAEARVIFMRKGVEVNAPVGRDSMVNKKYQGLAPALLASLHFPKAPVIKLYRLNGQPVKMKADSFDFHIFSVNFAEYEIGNQEEFYFEFVIQLQEASVEREDNQWTYLSYKPVYEKVIFKSQPTNFLNLGLALAKDSKEREQMRRALRVPAQAFVVQEFLANGMYRAFLLSQAGGLKTQEDYLATAAFLPKCQIAK